MKLFRGDRHRRPQHARPSVLAPTRAIVAVGGFGVVAVAVVAGCAAVTGRPAGAAPAPGRPSAVHPVLAGPAVSTAGPGSADLQRPRAGDAAGARTGFTTTPALTAILRSADPAPAAVPVSGLAASGIPSTALLAYKNAATREHGIKPACGISWPLLAGIGRVESNHGRFAGAILHADGVSTPRIIGIPLNGHGTALIRDTDGGRLDGDTTYDRAVGPMQFIPSTWASWGVDADHDGARNPFDVFDAAAAAADYLCAAGRDLTTTSGQVRAILSYNYSYDYVSMVMGLERLYATQVGVTVPVLPTSAPRHGRPHHKPPLPPVDPGPAGGVKTPTPPKKTPTPTVSGTHTSPSSSGSSGASTPVGTPTTSPDCPTATASPGASSSGASSSASSGVTSTSSSGPPPAGCPTAAPAGSSP